MLYGAGTARVWLVASPPRCARLNAVICSAAGAPRPLGREMGWLMKPGKMSTRIAIGCRTAAIVVTLTAFFPSVARAEQILWGCMAVSKTEYNAAKRKKMLHGKLGNYRRTGHIWRRSYWLCR